MIRSELGKNLGKRDIFYGTFERFGVKSGYKHTETTVLLLDIEDSNGNELTDHLWFNFTKEFRTLYEQLHLTSGHILQFNARVNTYSKGYDKFQFDYNLSHPRLLRIIGINPKYMKDFPCEPPYQLKFEDRINQEKHKKPNRKIAKIGEKTEFECPHLANPAENGACPFEVEDVRCDNCHMRKKIVISNSDSKYLVKNQPKQTIQRTLFGD